LGFGRRRRNTLRAQAGVRGREWKLSA